MNNTITRRASQCLAMLTGIIFSLCVTSVVLAGNANARAHAPQSLNFTPIKSSAKDTLAFVPGKYFVRFETPAVSEMVLASKALGAPVVGGTEQRGHARFISEEHNVQRTALESLGVRVLSTMRVGANGMRVQARPDQVAAIRALPGVKAVSKVALHTLDLSSSVPWIGTPAVWDSVGDGAGISIGIIDSGIDYLHSNMGGAGDPDEYANNDFNTVEAGTFPTAKVVGGWDFAGPDYDASSDDPTLLIPVPDPDPLDGNGHGSHVAGIAGGLGVAGAIGPGVAKGASLYALKVFNDTSGSTGLTADAIEWALDPNGDGDLSDHLDVINMSLGSPFGLPGDPSAIAASNAADLGIIVVASAGNSGNVPYVTGSPAVGANAISVAATTSGGDVLALGIAGGEAKGLYEAVEGAGPVRIADGAVSGTLVVADPLFACDTDDDGNPAGLSNDIAGGIALIQRGGCSFDLKFVNAQIAGASAVVVYNDGASPGRISPITMGGIGNLGIPITVPGLMIASTAGEFLNATISDGDILLANMADDLMTPTAYGDSMAGFSSRGPGHGGGSFKPDMSAPGVSTISTGAGSGSGGRALSGTSMAAPHVAGAAALMRQAFPDARVAAIKAMLMNSTTDAQPDGLVGPPHALSRQGVGVLRVDQATSLSSFAWPAGVSFGRLNHHKPKRYKVEVNVRNISDEDRTYSITHVPQQTMPGVTVSAPDSIRVKAGKTKKFKAELELEPSMAPADDGSFSHAEVDGWFVLNGGTDTLRVGYLAVVDAASEIKVKGRRGEVRLENKGSVGGIAEGFTLANGRIDDDDDDDDDGDVDTDAERVSIARDDDHPPPNTATVRDMGYRTAVLSGFGVVDLGVVLRRPWESMSDRTFEFYLDTDADGTDDVLLIATDFSQFGGAIGTMVTAQFDLVNGGGFLDWFVSVGDYNDHTAAFTFTRVADGGLVPDGFDYRLEVSSTDGSFSSSQGSIDLDDEIEPKDPFVVLAPGERFDIPTHGNRGEMLWLLQNDRVGRQSKTVRIR